MSTAEASEAAERWMDLALAEGRRGLGRTSPNPAVGAVIVSGGEVLGAGHHARAGEAHAEVNALRAAAAAGRDVADAELYVTLEPCSTTGRTPPCVDAILGAGLRRVTVGTVDPNPRHAGAGIRLLREAGVEVRVGVREDACAELIRGFRKHVLTGRPYVIAKTGMTLDGRITPLAGGSRWITGEAAREDVQRLRSEVDAILVGGETVRRDDPRLTLRGPWAEGREQPWRVVVTRSGDLPTEAVLFTDEHRDRTLVFHVEQLEPVFSDLGRRGMTLVLLECGGRLLAEAFAGGWVDEVVFYVAPIIGGGERRAVEGGGFLRRLRDPEAVWFGPDLRYRARVDPEGTTP
jgi:diaminohydroxyphosphoribosylaminopyrimidine deaminase/5-amino-6-(5-phosphoribosylamino)uracil reductase